MLSWPQLKVLWRSKGNFTGHRENKENIDRRKDEMTLLKGGHCWTAYTIRSAENRPSWKDEMILLNGGHG